MRMFSLMSLLAILTMFVTACNENDSKPAVKKAASIDSVAVFMLRKDSVNKNITFPAELLPLERAEIFGKVSGYVKTLRVDIGDQVSKGQLLATLEAPELISNYSQANADVQTARAKYLGSLDAYNRISNASKVEGTIAAGELEKVRNQLQADSSALEAARSKLGVQGQFKDYLVIRAPFSGIITQRNIDPGTLVGTGNTRPLLVLENTNSLRLRVPVPEAYTAASAEANSVSFSVDAQPGITYTAKLSRKSGALNLSNRTETWEFIYPNPGNQLKSGMFANAFLKLGRKEKSFLVPSTAIATTLEKRFVIRLNGGATEWVDVRTGITTADKVEIFGDLGDGDTLLVRATDEIKPGAQLVPRVQK